MFSDETGDISLLGRRTPACDNGGEFGCDLDELVREQVQAELDRPISLESSGQERNIDLKRFPIDDKTAIQFRLQELQLITNFVRSLDCSPRFEGTKRISNNPALPTTEKPLTFRDLMNILVPSDQLGRDRNTRCGLDLVASQHPNLDTRIPQKLQRALDLVL